MNADRPGAPQPHDPARPYPATRPEPESITGPSPTSTALGLILLTFAVLVLVDQLLGADIVWPRVLPWIAIGGGAVVLGLGLVGMLGSRRDDQG